MIQLQVSVKWFSFKWVSSDSASSECQVIQLQVSVKWLSFKWVSSDSTSSDFKWFSFKWVDCENINPPEHNTPTQTDTPDPTRMIVHVFLLPKKNTSVRHIMHNKTGASRAHHTQWNPCYHTVLSFKWVSNDSVSSECQMIQFQVSVKWFSFKWFQVIQLQVISSNSGSTPSRRVVPFSRLLRHAGNTSGLFYNPGPARGDLWEPILAAISTKCGLHSFLHLHTAVSMNICPWKYFHSVFWSMVITLVT
jgi:hypothetical protein